MGDVGGDAEPSHIGNEPFSERFKPFFDVVLAPEGYLVFVVPCQGYQLYTVFKSGLCSPVKRKRRRALTGEQSCAFALGINTLYVRISLTQLDFIGIQRKLVFEIQKDIFEVFLRLGAPQFIGYPNCKSLRPIVKVFAFTQAYGAGRCRAAAFSA